jgi:hypothetical protein
MILDDLMIDEGLRNGSLVRHHRLEHIFHQPSATLECDRDSEGGVAQRREGDTV